MPVATPICDWEECTLDEARRIVRKYAGKCKNIRQIVLKPREIPLTNFVRWYHRAVTSPRVPRREAGQSS
jgi:hypothetical protein